MMVWSVNLFVWSLYLLIICNHVYFTLSDATSKQVLGADDQNPSVCLITYFKRKNDYLYLKELKSPEYRKLIHRTVVVNFNNKPKHAQLTELAHYPNLIFLNVNSKDEFKETNSLNLASSYCNSSLLLVYNSNIISIKNVNFWKELNTLIPPSIESLKFLYRSRELMLIPLSYFRLVGGFDERIDDYLAYGNLEQRLAKSGLQISQFPSSIINQIEFNDQRYIAKYHNKIIHESVDSINSYLFNQTIQWDSSHSLVYFNKIQNCLNYCLISDDEINKFKSFDFTNSFEDIKKSFYLAYLKELLVSIFPLDTALQINEAAHSITLSSDIAMYYNYLQMVFKNESGKLQRGVVLRVLHGLSNRIRAYASLKPYTIREKIPTMIIWSKDHHCNASLYDFIQPNIEDYYMNQWIPEMWPKDIFRYELNEHKSVFNESHVKPGIPLLIFSFREVWFNSENRVNVHKFLQLMRRSLSDPVKDIIKKNNKMIQNCIGVHIRAQSDMNKDVPGLQNRLVDNVINKTIDGYVLMNNAVKYRKLCNATTFVNAITASHLSDNYNCIYVTSDIKSEIDLFTNLIPKTFKVNSMVKENVKLSCFEHSRTIECQQLAFSEQILMSYVKVFFRSYWSSFSDLIKDFGAKNIEQLINGCAE